MGIFSDIVGKIFHHAKPDAEPPPVVDAAQQPDPATPAPTPPLSDVDVAAVLDDLASQADQPLNWKTSIVDLMKLLDLDSSLEHRKALAAELSYDGDTSDSATMNIWLHRQVLDKLAQNGGKVPADLTA